MMFWRIHLFTDYSLYLTSLAFAIKSKLGKLNLSIVFFGYVWTNEFDFESVN